MNTLTKLQWEDKHSTGDAGLDFQHKYLFETFNKLADAIDEKQASNMINAILGRLKFYADWHFEKEEEYMERYNCPAAQVNKAAHAEFRQLFNRYYQEYTETGGSLELAAKVHTSLSDWLANHIMGVDRQLYQSIHGEKS